MIANLHRLRVNRRGVSVVEMALVMPLFLVMLFGILGYGQYFLIAHSVQQLANDAARATVAGLDATERRNLANASVKAEMASLHELNVAHIQFPIQVVEAPEIPNVVTVRVRYDASTMPLFRTTLVPMPDSMIERRAVIRPGGIS